MILNAEYRELFRVRRELKKRGYRRHLINTVCYVRRRDWYKHERMPLSSGVERLSVVEAAAEAGIKHSLKEFGHRRT